MTTRLLTCFLALSLTACAQAADEGPIEGAVDAADRLDRVLRGTLTPARARAGYGRFVRRATKHFFRLINAYYDPAFRDLFLDGTGPLKMHRAAITLLAGHTLPRPRFAVRWRMAAFYACVALQRRGLPLTERKAIHSLCDATPADSAAPARSVRPEPALV